MSTLANSEPALTFLIACCAKATILLACAWITVIALRQRSSALRHHVWAAAILASLALPFLALLLPGWRSATLGSAATLWSPAHEDAASSSSYAIPSAFVDAVAASPAFNKLAIAALIVWAFGFSLVLVRLVAGLARLAWISAHAKPIFDEDWMRTVSEFSQFHKLGRSVRLLQCSSPLAMPLTWGILRPVIVLPSGATLWTEDRCRIVLSHELAHIARHDWLLQICAEVTRCFYWFHPLVWLASARLRQESKRASDDAVLRSGIAPSHYASQLLDLARTLENSGRLWSTALAIARPSNLERRFAAMLNPSINRRTLSARTRFLVPFLALTFLLPLAALRLTAQNLSGKVSGSIHDISGTGVANATIIMSKQPGDIDMITMTTSDRDGNFSFKALPAGEYELKVMKRGFEPFRLPQVTLESGRDFFQSITLQPGTIIEEVEVVPNGTAKPLPSSATGKPSRIRVGVTLKLPISLRKFSPCIPNQPGRPASAAPSSSMRS